MTRSVEVLEAIPNRRGGWLAIVKPSWDGFRPLTKDERLTFRDGRAGRYHVVNSSLHDVPMLILYPEESAEAPNRGDILEVIEAA